MKRLASRRSPTLDLWRTAAITAAVCYAGWNAWWLAHGLVPPSLLAAATGLPSPTTGGTRAMMALGHGNWLASLRFNAMAVPISLLLVVSVAWPATQWLRGRCLALPPVLLTAWIGFLLTAWAIKLWQALQGHPL